LNPIGAEHTARFGICAPLYASDDPILRGNHVEGGIATYLAPIYTFAGGYAQISPATFFYARAELTGAVVWPLPISGAAYYARDGYGDRWSNEDVPAEEGMSSSGWSVRLIAVLRGRVELAPNISMLAFDAFWTDYDSMGSASFWLNVRHDLITARSDWVLANEAFVMIAAQVSGGPDLRFGVYSSMRAVPAAGYAAHHTGPIVMIAWDRADTYVASLDVFIRLGVYTHHRERERELTTMAGLSIDWDLGAL
jgi:hypothetical protein